MSRSESSASPRPARTPLTTARATSLKLCARPVPQLKIPDSLAMLEKIQIHVHHVLDMDEVAPLLAVGIAVRSGEEPDPALAHELVEGMKRDRSHTPLVRLVRAVNVEIAEARDLRAARRQAAPHMLIEQELGIGVGIEWPLAGALLAEFTPRAVHGGRRGVQKRHRFVLAPLEQGPRVAVVVLHHVAAVGLHGVRAGTLVQDRLDLLVELVRDQTLEEIALVHVVLDLASRRDS